MLRLMLVPLPSVIRVDPRRDALRLEYASYTYTHVHTQTRTYQPAATLASYVHHAYTLAYTTSAATIVALLFFFPSLFCFSSPCFFIAITITAFDIIV